VLMLLLRQVKRKKRPMVARLVEATEDGDSQKFPKIFG